MVRVLRLIASCAGFLLALALQADQDRNAINRQLKLDSLDKQLSSGVELKLRSLDETALYRLLIAMALLDATDNTYSAMEAEQLETVAKRHRINTVTIRKQFTPNSRRSEEAGATAERP